MPPETSELGSDPEFTHAVTELMASIESVLARWRQRPDQPLLRGVVQALPDLIRGLLQGIAAEGQALSSGDARTVARAAQRAVQPAGRAYVEAAWRIQGHTTVPARKQRARCPDCGRKLKLVRAAQPRHLVGRCGRYKLVRASYTCGNCGGSYCPDDESWGLGADTLDPDLLEVVARDGVDSNFAQAAEVVAGHLQVAVDDNTAQRITVGVGWVAREQNEQRAAADTPRLPQDPGSDTVLLEVDGGRVQAGREWREAKVAAAGPLGPAKVVDQDTGRAHLCAGPLHYAADITDADTFFAQGVHQVAEDAGLFHPRVRTVVKLSDGGEWIENRWASLRLPASVEVFDILDFRHLQEHLGEAAKACWGDNSPKTKAWVQKQTDTVLEKGPQPLLDELATIAPRRAKGRDELRKLRGYLERNAHRLRYPEFIARELPIGYGAIEAGVRIVNNERLKNSCMHWSVAGARSVLALRAIALSPPPRWQAFWDNRSWLHRPPTRDLAPLRDQVA